MQLTPEQKSAVASWIAAGASLSDVQKRLREEFQVSLTYIDTRFLVDDLGLDLKSPPKPKTPPPAPAGAPAPVPGAPATDAEAELIDDGDAYAAGADEFADDVTAPSAGAGSGKLTLEVDRVMRPGTVVSGSVTFSDGQTGKWALDQYGRLVFEPAVQGYRPSQADLQTFQRELSAQLQRQGY